MRVADYIWKTLADRGVSHVFLITGGGAMYLNDALGREKRISYVCNHHEQASSIAAEAYARVTGGLGVLNVTTGPGGVNALTGVFGAWTDSIPMLVVSGQVKSETCLGFYDLPDLRQLGDQEIDIARLVGSITKYAALVRDPKSIRYHLERAVHTATTGRPGPCWIDVPVDIQASMVDEEDLQPYVPDPPGGLDATRLAEACSSILRRIQQAKRPVILAGSGVRAAGAVELFERVVSELGIPVTLGWTAPDLLRTDHPLFCGRPGTVGDRPGNFTVQNADLVLVLGSRLNIRQVSYNWRTFAHSAFKIQVDIDPAELDKPTVKPDLPVECDLTCFLQELDRQLAAMPMVTGDHSDWVKWCRDRVGRYPVVLDQHRTRERLINPYHFCEELFLHLADDDVVVCGDGTASVVPFQVANIRGEQRLIANSGAAAMGFDIPAAVGAAVARGGKRVVCLAGDGSAQLNIQELQTIVHHRLPIKLFILNNRGYLSIRSTQQNFFPDNFVGEGPSSGVSFPDMVRLAGAYGIPAVRIEGPDFEPQIASALASEGPILCEVMLDPEQQFEPKLSSRQLPDGRITSPTLEDLAPFLDRDEFASNMLVTPPKGLVEGS